MSDAGSDWTHTGGAGGEGEASKSTPELPERPTKLRRSKRACRECNRKKLKCTGNVPCPECTKRGFVCIYNVEQKRGRKPKNAALVGLSPTSPQDLVAKLEPYDERDAAAAAGPVPSTSKAVLPSPTSGSSYPPPPPQGNHSAIWTPWQQPPPPPPPGSYEPPRRAPEKTNSYPFPPPPPPPPPPHDDRTSPVDPNAFTRRLFHGQGPHLAPFYELLAASELAFHSPNNSATPGLLGANEPSQPSPSFDAPHESVMFRLYWTIVHPLWPVIYRPSFNIDTTASNHPLLYHAMLAVTSVGNNGVFEKGSVVPGLRECSTRHASLFKSKFNFHSHQPRVSTVQALVLMAFREIASSEIYAAWMYVGAAIRMAFELHLHVRHPNLTHTDEAEMAQQEASRVIWTCYVLDKYLSLLLGRPMMLRNLDISAPLPNKMECDELSIWVTDSAGIVPASVVHSHRGVRTLAMTNFVSQARLSQILERIMTQIFSSHAQSKEARFTSLAELDQALEDWKAAYPAALGLLDNHKSVSSRPPHVAVLRMWYYTCCLILHRPFIPHTGLFQHGNRRISSYEICIESAGSIMELAQLYRAMLGDLANPSNALIFILFQVGVIFVAVSAAREEALAFHGASQLTTVLGWLDEIGGTYALTSRYRSVLSALGDLSRRQPANVAAYSDSNGMGDESSVIFPPPNALNSIPHSEVNGGVSLAESAPIFMEGTSNPLSNLHESFWATMPLNGIDANDWQVFTRNYDSILE